ncbi:MAG: mechanosensitive ion channel family protein [Candidatus Nanoarchaeia archaeon]
MKLLKTLTSFSFLDRTILQKIYKKAILAIIIILLLVLFQDIIEKYEYVEKLVRLFLIYILLSIIFNYGSSLINFLYRRRNKFQDSHIDNFTLGIKRLSFFLQQFIFILIFIHILFINILTLLTSLTIVAVALVIAFKEYISNFLYGITIMFSKNIQLKEYVKIGDFRGRVVNLTFENLELKTDSGDFVFIPNTLVYTKEITNFSKSSLKNIVTTLTLPKTIYPKYSTFKKQLIKHILKNYPELVKNEQIMVKICDVKPSEININVDIVTTKYTFKLENEVIDTINQFVISYISKIEESDEKKKSS